MLSFSQRSAIVYILFILLALSSCNEEPMITLPDAIDGDEPTSSPPEAEDINKGPIVGEMIPSAGKTLAVNGVVIISFTHIMDPESVFIRVGDTDGTVTTDDNVTFTWTPVADMPLGPTEIIVYGENANHVPFVAATPEEPATFDITVVEADTTPPAVIETIPAQDETVDVRERITIKFSEPIRHNFTAKIHPLPSKVYRTFRARNLVEFSARLKPRMNYTLELRGVMDYTGNVMPVYQFRFKTSEPKK